MALFFIGDKYMKKRTIFGSLLLLFLLILGGVGGWLAWVYYVTTPLAFNKELKETSKIYDRDGVLLDELHGEEHRVVVTSNDIDPDIKAAVIAIEDASYYDHKGVSVRGVGRAVNKAVKDSIAAGEVSISEGASTIPMQLAKNINGNVQDRTFANKIIETVQAIKLTNTYSKDEILTKYLNVIYWGNNTYGIQTATQTYFGKDANDVEVHEAAMLAAMIQNPSAFNPYGEGSEERYEALKNRQRTVLFNMSYDYSSCTQTKDSDGAKNIEAYETCLEEWTLAQAELPLLLSGAKTWKEPTGSSGYIVGLAINEMIEQRQFGINSKEDLENQGLGLNIYSTISLKDQEIAQSVVQANANNKGGAQIATTGIDPTTGKVLFSIGGIDYNKLQVNLATKYGGLKGRQPGSSVKPWVYYTAMGDFNWGPNSTILDAPYCPTKATRWEKAYCPRNYGGGFAGMDTLTNHLARSRNIPAVKLGQYVGIKNVIRNMRAAGYTTKLEAFPSFPLGANDVYLDEHAAGYASFANGGYKVEHSSLERVENTQGETLYKFTPNLTKVLNDNGVININKILRYAATNGTGVRANTIDNVYAKTGTTDAEADVMCMSYVPGVISIGTWIGNLDYHKKMPGASSVNWACPINGAVKLNLRNNNSI